MSKQIWCVSLAAVVGAGVALGGALFGTVKDDSGAPLAGAQVAVFGKELNATTDADGTFRITSADLLDGNKYSVTVTADGYDVAQTISVEMYEDAADMDPIEIEMYKTEVIAADTNTTAVLLPEGMDTNAVPPAEATDTNAPGLAADLIDVEEPAAGTNAAPAR